MMNYEKYLQKSLEDPVDFWAVVANKLRWTKKWTKVMDESNSPFIKWFVGGELNACDNCVDQHVEAGHGDKVAFIYDSPVTDIIRQVTFNELQEKTSKVAGVLNGWGLRRGDIALVYMPTIPEAFTALLACTRLGVIYNTVLGGLPPEDLSIRIQHSEPKVILCASHGYHPQGWVNYKENVDKAIAMSTHKPQKCLMYQRPRMDKVKMANGIDVDWEVAVSSTIPHGCVPLPATDAMFMLYTSGSTGEPKAIVHSLGSYLARLVSGMEAAMPRDEEVIFATASFGWMVAHSAIVYAPLINRVKTVLFECDPLLLSDPRTFYRVIDNHQVSIGVVRSGIIRAISRKDPDGSIAKEYNFLRLKIMFVGSEHIDVPTIEWAQKTFGVYIQNVWGQTESSGGILGAAVPSKNTRYSLTGYPYPGFNVQVIDTETMTQTKPGEIGRLLIKLPLPPGMLQGLFKNEELCRKTYFDPYPGYYDTKDDGYVDADGKLKMEHRADDLIRAGPIDVAATAIEQHILQNRAVEEVLVAAMPHNTYLEIPIAIVVPKKDHHVDPPELIKSVKTHFGPSMPFETVVCVSDLPRSRTGKSHRTTITNLLKGVEYVATGEIENPQVMEEIRSALGGAGLAVK